MHDNVVLNKLENIEQMLREHNLLQKEMLTLEEAASYIDVSKSHMYKMTHWKILTHYCPNGKKLYFKRLELDQWLQKNKKVSREELEAAATSYTLKNRSL